MRQSIAIIGGSGKLGAALARRFAKAGFPVIIGSRSPDKAMAAAAEIGHGAIGADNVQAASAASIIIVTAPFAAQEQTLREIAPCVQGKLVIETTVPLVPFKAMRVQLPPEGSAAVRAQNILGEGVTLVSAFHNVAAHKLATDAAIDCDILVFGDLGAARGFVVDLIKAIGLRGIHGGALVNSAAAEAMTSILIYLNKTYQGDGVGLRITGDLIEPKPEP